MIFIPEQWAKEEKARQESAKQEQQALKKESPAERQARESAELTAAAERETGLIKGYDLKLEKLYAEKRGAARFDLGTNAQFEALENDIAQVQSLQGAALERLNAMNAKRDALEDRKS